MDDDCDNSRRSGRSGYTHRQTFTPYRSGPLEPEQTRADMIYEQTGLNTNDQTLPKPIKHRPDSQHAGPRSDRGSQASSYNQYNPYDKQYESDETVRLAPPRSSTSTRRRKPSSNRPRSPAHSAISQQSRITARRVPLPDGRPPSPRYAQTSTPSEQTFGDPLSSRQQLPRYNDASGQFYDFPPANFPSSSNDGSSRHRSRPVSSPQRPGKGFTPDELQGRMNDLSISGPSSNRHTSLSGGMYCDNPVSRDQYSGQRPPENLSRPTIDLGPLDPRKQMVDFLRPIRESILPYVRPEDSIKAIGAVVIAEQRLADVIHERMTQHSNAPAYPRDTVAGSVQWPDDGDSRYNQSSRDGRHRQPLEAPPPEGYTNFPEESVRSGARDRHDDSPFGRNHTEEREPSFMSHRSGGYSRQPPIANSRNDLQLKQYERVPHLPSSQRSTHRAQLPAFRDFGDDRSMSAGTQNSRGPSMQSSRGVRGPGPFDEGRY
jgi:hypothetical protein